MRFESALTDMRPVFVFRALTLILTAVVATPSRAQQSASPACVSAIGPDVSQVTNDSNAVRGGALTPRADSGARANDVTVRSTANPTVRLLASVQADEVRFASQPKICVKLRGDAQLDTVRVVARRNMRSPVTVGTTYRNVYVAVEILGHLNARCISARITGQPTTGACASLEARDSTSSGPPSAGAP